MTKLNLPLYVMLPRKTKPDKKFILNLNNYRNTHQMVLNQAKHIYADIIKELVGDNIEHYDKCQLIFTYYHGNKGRIDKSNPLSIIEKFACDALTDLGFWEDDNSEIIPETIFRWGGIDKENPRCELEIIPIDTILNK